MPVIRAILLSLLVHFLLMLGMALFPSDPNAGRKDVTEVDIVSPPPEKKNSKEPQKQIVRSALTPEQLKAQDDTTLAKYLSEQKNRTRKETQAAQTGLTKNRANGAVPEDSKAQDASQTNGKDETTVAKKERPRAPTPQPPQDSRTETDRELEKEGFKAWNPGQDPRQARRRSAGGASTVSDRLPTDVSVGSFTSLNTDQYTYYTFYARIEELIRFRWETRVQNSIDSFDRNTVLNVIGRKTWVTDVEFLLSPDGRLQKSMIMKESGVPKFDQAAINAFKEAGMFPNPPRELVEEDGYIHLKYAFAVYFNPSSVGIR